MPGIAVKPVLYPNPSTGIFNCLQQGAVLTADEIAVTNAQGLLVGDFKNAKQFNISQLAAGIYWYRLVINGALFTGKLLKE